MAVQAIVIIFDNVSVDGSVGMHVRHHMADVAFMSITMMEVTVFTGRGLGSSDEGASAAVMVIMTASPRSKMCAKKRNLGSPGRHCSSANELYIT
jgi:hypothetical protein